MSNIFSIFLLVIASSIILAVIGYLSVTIFRGVRQGMLGYGVPFVRTPDEKLTALLEHIELEAGETFLDIGCGDGKVLEAMSERYRESHIIGYESSPHPYALALERREKHGGHYSVYPDDFFTVDISSADVIYSYMMPHLMERIWKKVSKECRVGTRLYSSSFAIPGVPISRTIECAKDQYIYEYRVGE